MKYVLMFIILFTISCTDHSHTSKVKKRFATENDSLLYELKSQEFLYIDNDSVLHLKLRCGIPRVDRFKTELKKIHAMKRITLNNITPDLIDRCCAVCISDDDYKFLKNLSDSIYEHKILYSNSFN